MQPSTEPRHPRFYGVRNGSKVAAFSLVELLVGVAILGLLSAGLASVLSSDLLSNRNLQTYQSLRGQVGRARRFLELESSAATRLQWRNDNNGNTLLLSGLNNGTAYTITYELVPATDALVPATDAGVPGVKFRGPFVLRRSGPPYTADGSLANSAGTTTVLLDGLQQGGLQNDQGSTINAAQTSSDRSARMVINLSEQGTTYTSDFSLATAAPTSFGLLQSTQTNASLSGCQDDPNGCREANGIQEWDTRLMGIDSRITIPRKGTPSQVIVYFNSPFPAGNNAIRRTSSTTSPIQPCIRTSCYIDFASGSDYDISANGSRVDKLVFLDRVINVPSQ
jgi:type II secretory pathway pseudopilin PulG